MKFTLKSINLAEKRVVLVFISPISFCHETPLQVLCVCVRDLLEGLIFWAKSQMLHILPSHGVFQAWVKTAD